MSAQVGIVAIFASRISLSANYPEPIEATADLGLLSVQLGLGVLLAPMLLSQRRHVWIAIASAFPLLSIAECLAGASRSVIGVSAVVDALWLCSFALFRSGVGRQMMVLLVIAAPIVRYLAADFGTRVDVPPWVWAISPVLAIAGLRDHTLPIVAAIWPVWILIICGWAYCKWIERSNANESD